MKRRILKAIRNTVISIVILAGILISGGVAYIWYTGEYGKSAPVAQVVETPVATATPQRTQPAANAKVGVSLQALASPVAPGESTSITVKTLMAAECTIKVVYDKAPSTDPGLIAKTADDYGIVEWTWTVDTAAPTGKWPVTVTCRHGKQSAVLKADLVVKKAS